MLREKPKMDGVGRAEYDERLQTNSRSPASLSVIESISRSEQAGPLGACFDLIFIFGGEILRPGIGSEEEVFPQSTLP